MFGFLPDDGEGDCALVVPGALRMHATARISVYGVGFMFIGFGLLFVIIG
jgi:hypothetical protein